MNPETDWPAIFSSLAGLSALLLFMVVGLIAAAMAALWLMEHRDHRVVPEQYHRRFRRWRPFGPWQLR